MEILAPAPGWYANPDNPTELRYWSGCEWTEHTAPYPAPAPAPKQRRTLLWVGGALLLLMVLGVAASVLDGSQPKDDKLRAFSYCKEAIQQKTAGTSTFRNREEVSFVRHGNTYSVISTVDSPSVFGMRTEFTCVVSEDNDNWRLVSLWIGGAKW